MTTTPPERLRSSRAAAGYASAAEAARARGWTEATYRHHENGTRRFSADHARAYGRAFGVSPSWLLGLNGDPKPSKIEEVTAQFEDPEELSRGIEVEISDNLKERAGQSLVYHFEPENFKETYFVIPSWKFGLDKLKFKAFDANLLSRLANVETTLMFSIYAPDSSMSPTIKDGALLLIDGGERELNRQDSVWLIEYAEQVMLRRLRSLPNAKVEIYCDNGAIRPLIASLEDIAIRGRAVWVGQEI